MWNFPLWYQDGAQKVSDSEDLNPLLAMMYKNENVGKKSPVLLTTWLKNKWLFKQEIKNMY